MWFYKVNMFPVAPFALRFTLTIKALIDCVLDRVVDLNPCQNKERVGNVAFNCCG